MDVATPGTQVPAPLFLPGSLRQVTSASGGFSSINKGDDIYQRFIVRVQAAHTVCTQEI